MNWKLLGLSILINFSSMFLIDLVADFEMFSYLLGGISMLLYSDFYVKFKGSDKK